VTLSYKGTVLTSLTAESSPSFANVDEVNNILSNNDAEFKSTGKTSSNDPWLYIALGDKLVDKVVVQGGTTYPSHILGARISIVANTDPAALAIYEYQNFPQSQTLSSSYTFTFPDNDLRGMTSSTPCAAGTYATNAGAWGCAEVTAGAYPTREIKIEPNTTTNKFGIVANADFSSFIVAVRDSNLGLMKSVNSGLSWTSITSDNNLNLNRKWYYITSSTDFTKFIACAENSKLVRSLNGGSTWTELSGKGIASGPHGWISIAASDDFTKFASTDDSGNISMSTDSGDKWTTVTSAGNKKWLGITSNADLSKLAASVYEQGYLYLSQDGGETWTEIHSAGARAWQSITASESFDKFAVVDHAGYIYMSVDTGATWTALSRNLPPGQWCGIIATADFSKLAATKDDASGIYVSYNSGSSWHHSGSVFDESALGASGIRSCAAGKFSVAGNTGCTLCPAGKYAASGSSACTNCVAGKYLTQSANIFGGSTERNCTSCAAGKTSSFIAATTSGVCTACLAGKYSSAPAATSQSQCLHVPSNKFPSRTVSITSQSLPWKGIVASIDFMTIIAAAGNYLYKSSDGGATWSTLAAAGLKNWWDVAGSSDLQSILASVNDGGLYTSYDGGATWKLLSSAGAKAWRGVTCSADFVNMAAVGVGESVIWVSQNSGNTWGSISLASVSPVSKWQWQWRDVVINADLSSIAIMSSNSTAGSIYVSTDSGATWAKSNSAGDRAWRYMAADNDMMNIIASVGGSIGRRVGQIHSSNDAGITWHNITEFSEKDWAGVTYVNVSANVIDRMAAADGSPGFIYHSIDSGESWVHDTPIITQVAYAAAAISDCPEGTYSSGGNSGCTFPIPTGLPTGRPTGIPTSKPTNTKYRPTQQPTFSPTITFQPTHLLAYVSLSFKIEGLERRDITSAMEQSMKAIMVSGLQISESAVKGSFSKVDVAPRGARFRRSLVATKAVRVTAPLSITVMSINEWEGAVIMTEENVVNYVTTKFVAMTSAATNNFIRQVMDKLAVSRLRGKKDNDLLQAIHSNPSLLPYMDPVDILASNSHPTQAPTDYILPIGADKPEEDVVGTVLWSILGVVGAMMGIYVYKHLKRHFLLAKQQALVHERHLKVQASSRKVVKRAMTVLHMGVHSLKHDKPDNVKKSMSVGSTTDSGTEKKVAAPMHAFAYKKVSPLPQDEPEPDWKSAAP